MTNQIAHDLAIAYANSKLSEFLLNKREAPFCADTSLSKDEVQYLESAYEFARKNLSE